jgi:formyltetrahydrofolate synthetase
MIKTQLEPIGAIAEKLAIPTQYIEPLGLYGAKLKLELLRTRSCRSGGN